MTTTSGVAAYLTVHDAAKAIEFYQAAFGATEVLRLDGPGGQIAHAEIDIAGHPVMICDPLPWFSTKPPTVLGGTSASVLVYIDDVDAAIRRAVDAGATLRSEPKDMFWGDRLGEVFDPFGHSWLLATHVEDLAPEEIAERARAAAAG
jgi:PhnB protein